jgi:hypothetical protein
MKIELRELRASYLLEGDIIYFANSDTFMKVNTLELLNDWIHINRCEGITFAWYWGDRLEKDILVFRERQLPQF